MKKGYSHWIFLIFGENNFDFMTVWGVFEVAESESEYRFSIRPLEVPQNAIFWNSNFEKGHFGALLRVGSKNGFQIRIQRPRKPPIQS